MKYTYKLRELPKKTVEIELSVPYSTIEEEYEKVFEEIRKKLKVEGFRKGKVPKEIAKKYIKETAVFEEVIKNILPKFYEEILKKESLRPIIQPKVEVVSSEKNKTWKFKITLALMPKINLEGYKTLVKKIKKEMNAPKIWTPDSSQNKEDKNAQQKQNEVLNKILDALLKELKFEISDLVIEEEVNKRLAQLVDDVKRAGLTMEAYLRAKNLTIDKIKESYKKEIEAMYKMEYILLEIANKENISVEQKELDNLFLKIKDEKERENAKKNSYYYASILRKQKTLDFLLSL